MSLHFTLGNVTSLLLTLIHIAMYFDFRENKRWRVPLALFLCLAPFILTTPFWTALTDPTGRAWPIKMIMYTICNSLLCRYVVFKSSYKKIVYCMLAVSSFATICILLSHGFAQYILRWPQDANTFHFAENSQVFLYAAAMPFLYRYSRTPFRMLLDKLDELDWHIAFLSPILLYMTSYLMVGAMYNHYSSLVFVLSIIVSVNTLVFYFYSYWTIVRENKYRMLQEMIASFNEFLPYMELYNQELDRKERTIRTIRHDLRHVLGGLTLAARSGDIDSLISVVQSVAEIDDGLACIQYTDNKAINGIISFYFSIAGNKGVKCTAELAIPDPPGIPQPELVMLFGNALKNCTQAVTPLGSDGYITVRARQVNDCLVLKTINNFKPDKYLFGERLGLGSMRMLCEKRGGRLDVETVDEEFRLTAILKLDQAAPASAGAAPGRKSARVTPGELS